MRAGQVLIVLGDLTAHPALAEEACAAFDGARAASCAGARELARSRTWRALVIEVSLPDGSGLDLLQDLRASGCSAPTALIARACRREIVNRAFDLDAHVLCTPVAADRIGAFLRRATEQPPGASALDALVGAHGLTRCESELIAAALAGVPRRHFVESRGISPNTYKTQVRAALRKLGARGLDELRSASLARRVSPQKG